MPRALFIGSKAGTVIETFWLREPLRFLFHPAFEYGRQPQCV